MTRFTDIELPSSLKLPYTDVELQTPDNVVLRCFLIRQAQLVLLSQVYCPDWSLDASSPAHSRRSLCFTGMG